MTSGRQRSHGHIHHHKRHAGAEARLSALFMAIKTLRPDFCQMLCVYDVQRRYKMVLNINFDIT